MMLLLRTESSVFFGFVDRLNRWGLECEIRDTCMYRNAQYNTINSKTIENQQQIYII